MKKHKIIIYIGVCGALFLAAFFPSQAFAKPIDGAECSAVGYTVAFINGVFDSRDQAQSNAAALQLALVSSYKGEPVHVQLAYNPEHLGGGGDLVETISQMLFSPISDYDQQDLLRQLSTIDTTQKLLITGFSQGALYGNSIYEQLIANGEPANSLGVYAIATPSNYVAGGGAYLNSNEDAVLFAARAIAEKLNAPLPLPGNVDLTGSLAIPDLLKTHAFASYLGGAHQRITSDIYRELDELREWKSPPSKKSICISVPDPSLVEIVQKALFSIADPAAVQFKTTLVSAYQDAIAIAVNVFAVAQAGYAAISTALGLFGGQVAVASNAPIAPENQEKNFNFVKKLYGSSVDQETYDELNPAQDSAAAPAVIPAAESTISVVEVSSTSTPVAPNLSDEPSAPATNTHTAWVYTGGTGLPSPQVESSENTATTTTSLPTEAPPTTESTSSPSVATTSPQAPPVFTPEHSPISDTFNAFNHRGWQVFGQNVKNFDFDDGEDGECLRRGCAVGMGGNAYDTLVPRMYIQTGSGLSSGAYTLYVKARAGFNNPFPAITICAAGYNACSDNGSTKGISFTNAIPLDNEWHHYYIAWKPGDSFVQSCFMQDYRHFSDCVWVDTDFAVGTTFDGIALWSTNSWRADVAPNANLWFDELEAQ